jgi:transposase
VAVPPDRDAHPVRVFDTFTEDLHRLADWLVACGITTVAMESTGVYWIPLYDILEARGLRPCLVNARHMKNVPGRRTDWHECQWLQYLHSVGLLRSAFRPQSDVCAVRVLIRHREELVQMASQHVQHMHKALTQMNLQIHHVISDITGLTPVWRLWTLFSPGSEMLQSWQNCAMHVSRPRKTRSANLWWATGGQSFCSPSGNRASCIGGVSNK